MVCSDCQESPPGSFPGGLWSYHRPEPGWSWQTHVPKPLHGAPCAQHLVLSPSCGQIHSPAAPLPGTPRLLWLRLLGTKGHQRGFEKLEHNLPAGQGVNENMEQTEKWENRSGCKHKGVFFVCSDMRGPDHVFQMGSVGIKAAGA